MQAPKAKPGEKQPEPSNQHHFVAPFSTVLPEEIPARPEPEEAEERYWDEPIPQEEAAARKDAPEASHSGRLESKSGTESSLRWPQWHDIEPSMARQRIPASLVGLPGIVFILPL